MTSGSKLIMWAFNGIACRCMQSTYMQYNNVLQYNNAKRLSIDGTSSSIFLFLPGKYTFNLKNNGFGREIMLSLLCKNLVNGARASIANKSFQWCYYLPAVFFQGFAEPRYNDSRLRAETEKHVADEDLDLCKAGCIIIIL